MALKNQVENIRRNKKKFEKPLMIIDLIITQGLLRFGPFSEGRTNCHHRKTNR